MTNFDSLLSSITDNRYGMSNHLFQAKGINVGSSPLSLRCFLGVGGQEIKVVPHFSNQILTVRQLLKVTSILAGKMARKVLPIINGAIAEDTNLAKERQVKNIVKARSNI